MKKKIISKTYLRDVTKHKIMIDTSNDEYYYSVKKIIECTPFISYKNTRLIDNNYYIFELIPKNEKYAMRVFLDDKKQILEYYFDMILGSNIDEDTKVPYFIDGYTDIIIDDMGIKIVDENELDEAYANGTISKEDYELVKKTTKELYTELKNNTNKYKNMDIIKLINI